MNVETNTQENKAVSVADVEFVQKAVEKLKVEKQAEERKDQGQPKQG